MDRVQREQLAAELARTLLSARQMAQQDGKIHANYTKCHVIEVYCPRYISMNEYSDLANLSEFITNNPDIDNVELKKIFKLYPTTFVFLRKLIRQFDDLAMELRQHGMMWILTQYCGDKRMKELLNLTRLG